MDETTKITTLAQYSELRAGLTDLAKRASVLMVPDKAIQKELQQNRAFVINAGKYLRADYRAKADGVMQVEKEHLAIIEGEENRLKLLKEEADKATEVEYRKSQFDARTARLATLGVSIEPSQNIEMDDTKFEAFYQAAYTKIMEEKQRDLEAREKAVKDAELAQEREAEAKRREEQARIDERAKIERDAIYAKEKADRDLKEANERTERAAQMERDKIVQEAEAKALREAEEKKKLEADIAFNMWLESLGWTEETKEQFIIEKNSYGVCLSKILGVYTIE